jgi:predicted GNAT family acetyltransferase
MRASEFLPSYVIEAVNTDIMKRGWTKREHRDGLDLRAAANEQGLSVYAYDAGGRQVGFVHFEIIGNNLESFDTWVDSRMRRQGIATVMYNYAKELGNDIAPSSSQTPDGKKFWKSIKQQTTESREEFNQALLQPGFEFTQKINKVTYKVTSELGQLMVTAWDPEGKQIGRAVFWKHQTRSGLESQTTEVAPWWHGKGIATNMYAIVRMLGANINPSLFQSKQGKDMWKKWQQQGDVAQLKNMNAKLKNK